MVKNIGAVLAGFVIIVALSVITDMVVEKVGILPPANQPDMYMWWHLLIALLYRSAYAVSGGYVTAKLSPQKPMRNVISLAVLGTVIGTLGTVSNWEMAVQSGVWYPIVLLVTSPFLVWYGGKLRIK